jgi:UPF0176 protein
MKQYAISLEIKGTILLADEGINGTISGSTNAIRSFQQYLFAVIPSLRDMEFKSSYHHQIPFSKMKVRLKHEIVRLAIDNIYGDFTTGNYCNAQQWDQLISEPNTTIIDTRNDYEYRLGTFKNAINPKTSSFREISSWLDNNLTHNNKVAMFCTGGIRCEKSTAYLKAMDYGEVYHLKGGILGYFEEKLRANKPITMWEGDCFVFDDRVAVNPHLQAIKPISCEHCGIEMRTDDVKASPADQWLCQTCLTQLGLPHRHRSTTVLHGKQQHINNHASN